MKQLFERFEQQSQTVEKVLEKSIELIRKRKSPGLELCTEIDAALRELHSIYNEITKKLPENIGGIELPVGASARELETIWQESAAVKRNSLIAVLSEFINVYSDDAWYLEAIQDQLDEAKSILAQMEEDEKANPDVSSYAIFLECVKQDLDVNIELAHTIEDHGINGFSFRAISGLQKKKYYIRKEQYEENPETIIAVEKTAEKKGDQEDKGSEKVDNPLENKDGVEQVSEIILPLKPIKKNLKIPNRKEFQDLAKKFFPVFHMICRNLGCLQVASEEMISRFVYGSMSAEIASRIDLKGILNSLETKGYLASYEFSNQDGKQLVYCQTDLLRSILQKDNYRQIITSKEDHKDYFPLASFVAKDQVSLQELQDRYTKAESVSEMFEYYSNMYEIIKKMFCLWNEEKGYHTNRITLQSKEILNTIVLPYRGESGPVIFPSETADIIIVAMTGVLPHKEILSLSDNQRVFCINKTWLYELVDGAWIRVQVTGEWTENASEDINAKNATEDQASDYSEKMQGLSAEIAEASAKVEEEIQEIENGVSQKQDEISDVELANDNEDNAAWQKLLEVAYKCFGKGKFYAGMTILHGLELENERFHKITERFGFAVGDPYLELDNRFANLQSVYDRSFGTDAKYDFLACAAYLRMYCSPTAAFDPYSIKDISFLKDNIACSTFQPLNDLLNSIARYVGRFQHGLDDRTVAATEPKQSQLDRISECSKKAKEIQDAKLYLQTRQNNRVNKTRWQLFSENSEIQAMLSIVAGDNRAEVNKVKAFLKGLGITGIVEDDVIDMVMQKAWDDNADAAKEKKADSLKGAERSCMMRQLRSIFECLSEWAAEVESGDKTRTSEIQDTLHLMKDCRNYLSAAVEDIQKKTSVTLQPEDAASYVILRKTAETILDRLEGKSTQENYRRNFYIELLKAPYVALDDERMPIVESKEEQICNLDFCNRAAMYLDDAVSRREWRDVVKKIFTYSADRKCYNFGCAEIIRKYLEELGQNEKFGEYNTQKAITTLSLPNKVNQSPSRWREDFIARFEMAKSDEWFDFDTIQKIEERVNAQKELYYNADNFGIYGQALQRMIAYFDETAQRNKPLHQHRLDALKENFEELQNKPIIQAIQSSIDKLRFGEAISFLDEADKGNFDIIESNVQPESKRFEEFLGRYASFYESAKVESGLSLDKAFTQSHSTTDTEDYRSAVAFLENWPQKAKANKAGIETILRNIGHDNTLKSVTEKDGIFTARFNDPLDDMSPHPIAEFGSIMYMNGLQIAVVDNASDQEDLYRTINARLRTMDKGIPVLIIVDTAIHLDVRRQLAKMFMSSLRIYNFIILDRVMALNIAEERKASRWNTLLCCAVPFQPVNPYSDDPNDEIPKEMFFGRVSEINDIINTKTATLVYGGRQLGKTALLHQARNLSANFQLKKWASYVTIKDKKVSEAAQIIGDTLLNNQKEKFFFSSSRKTWTWNILISTIHDRLTYVENCKDEFFLLIDEADAFLKDSAKRNYTELEDLLQIVTDTNNRFRFVLAGLRDVVRFHRGANANNNIVSKFKQLPIKPLDFKDARQLLVKPLSYLGYTFSDEEGDVIAQILHSTNYFPGIIHFYAHKLIEKKQESFNSSSSPTFKLDRNDLLLLLKDKKFLELRKSRLEITLELDEKEDKYYNTLALLLSYYNYGSVAEKGKNYSQYGATPMALLECAKSIEKDARISKLSEDQLTAVLEELCDLYILRGVPDDEGVVHYDFARTAFADMLGRKDEVQMKLISLMAEGGHDDD